MRDFYLVLKAKVEAGQYILVDMIADIVKGYEKNLITFEQMEELKALAEIKVDANYTGNKYPRPYDLDQDVQLSTLDASVLEIYEMLIGTMSVQTATQKEKIATTLNAMVRSGIGDVYLRSVLRGDRKFSEVHPTKQQEVADKLIAMGRQDLIDVPEYLPKPPTENINPLPIEE
ncbi:MAG: hypothetical protein ACRCX8_09870 [Sarcina sp.]